MQTEQLEKIEALAREINDLSRHTLLVNLRFLERAFLKTISVTGQKVTEETATEGQYLYYSAPYQVRAFEKDPNLVTRNMLHSVLHCLYRHIFVSGEVNHALWNLSCDIQVENQISELKIQSLYTGRVEQQAWLIKKLKEEIPSLTAERIYHYFCKNNIDQSEILSLSEAFHADDHHLWYEQEVESGSGKDDQKKSGNNDRDASNPDQSSDDTQNDNAGGNDEKNAPQGSGLSTESGRGGRVGDRQDDRANTPMLKPEELKKKWHDISEQVEVNLDTFSSSYGSGTGELLQEIRRLNRETYDYSEFLRKFSVMGENVELNDDEFDYIFYTLGMNLYGNMPLIEPLEYREVKKIREFVIAIDTSESVAGDLVQAFVQKTWNILKQTNNFFSRVNIHIIQCSARVTSDVRIRTDEEFDAYMKNFRLLGFGGTDFRPAFTHVNTLIRQHEFANLRGIIYFTDGYGTFPMAVPGYDACFVFLDQGREIPEVPAWAMKLVLKEEDLEKL